eukprot:Pgem_evm1s10590
MEFIKSEKLEAVKETMKMETDEPITPNMAQSSKLIGRTKEAQPNMKKLKTNKATTAKTKSRAKTSNTKTNSTKEKNNTKINKIPTADIENSEGVLELEEERKNS